MNTEEVKTRLETDLLAIIKEGQNLKEGEYVEIIPGVRVKEGREREFARLCDNYYEMEFNQIIDNDTDTITPVYEKLVKLVETETEDYYISKASDFVLEVKNEVERFKNLTKSFNTVDNAYKLTVRELNDLYLKRENTPSWQQKVDELNGEVRRLTENSAIITEQILAARKNVNETLIKYAEEQMEDLRQSFLNTSKDADKAPTDDHNFVLAKDVLEYNSLYRLVLILKQANKVDDIEKLVCLDDVMMVTEDQKNVLTSTILPNIKLYEYIKAPEKKEINKKEVNKNFLEDIFESVMVLKNYEEKYEKKNEKLADTNPEMAKKIVDERNRLAEIAAIIRRANASGQELVPVWDRVYVLGADKNRLIKLLNESERLYMFSPNYSLAQENERLIEELYSYLDAMANKVINYKGVANLPIKSTNTVDDRAWVVIKEDEEEANRIVEIINLLKKQTGNLIPVWGIANVNGNDVPKVKRLMNSTKFFSSSIPNIKENQEEIKKVHDELTNLIKKAKESKDEKLASNGLVLESDLELYKLLEEKYKYLEDAKASSNLVPVDGAMIDEEYAPKYHEINEKIKALTTKGEVDLSANDKEIARLEARLNELNAKQNRTENDLKEMNLLKEQINILNEAKELKDEELEDVNGVKVASGDKEEYIRTLVEMDSINSARNLGDGGKEKTSLRKKIVKSYRKLKAKAYLIIKENWKQILTIGLSALAMAYFLPRGISTSHVIPAIAQTVAKLGIVGIGGVSIGYGFKQIVNNIRAGHLPYPKVEKSEQEVEDLENIENNEIPSSLTQNDLINAQIEYEANKENLTGEGQTIEEIVENLDKEETQEQESSVNIFKNGPTTTPKDTEPSKDQKETDEERFKRGQAILDRLAADKKKHEAAKKEGSKKDTDEALKRIEDRAAEFTDQRVADEVAAAVQRMKEEDAAKAQSEQAAPVVEVPSDAEVIRKLGVSEEPELLDVDAPVIPEPVPSEFSTEDNEQVTKIESEIASLQKAYDNAKDIYMKEAFERAIAQKNAELDSLKRRGRG